MHQSQDVHRSRDALGTQVVRPERRLREARRDTSVWGAWDDEYRRGRLAHRVHRCLDIPQDGDHRQRTAGYPEHYPDPLADAGKLDDVAPDPEPAVAQRRWVAAPSAA